MFQIQNMLKRSLTALLITLLTFLSPMTVIAQSIEGETPVEDSVDSTNQSVEFTPEASSTQQSSTETEPSATPPGPSATSTSSPPSPTPPRPPKITAGPTTPTGADASTYIFNEETGLWENDKYTWDPVTKQTKPKQKQEYSYNPTTGMWDTTEWYFSPEQKKYLPNTVSVSQNPTAPRAATISNTGPSSNNNITIDGQTNGNFDLFFDASISNKIGQMSASGNASVQGNTLGGNALSGDAETLLTLLNMLQSAWGELGSEEIATFIANINGDIVGDLYIDPSQVGGGGGDSNININATYNAEIDNDIDVEARSGNADVSGNTTGGNATTGNARALINLINMINSAIYANRSFVGILNINGNLDGDILLPTGLLQAIIAATGPNSNNSISADDNDSLNVNVDTNRTIINNVNAQASSGDALVTDNTNAGSASTGKADTSIVLLNLTGRRVVAKNALLVFINVLGSWVGLIMDAPAGTYAVAATGPDSTNTINSSDNDNLDISITENSRIANNINAAANSGDATVSENTNAGSAASGNASVGVNILNMIDSEFEISDWFGILFINVFGNWTGSFGVNTSAGNPRPRADAGGMGGGSPAGTVASVNNGIPEVFRFVARNNAAPSGTNGNSAVTSAGPTTAGILPATGQTSSTQTEEPGAENATAAAAKRGNVWLPVAFGAVAVMLMFGERIIAFVRRPG